MEQNPFAAIENNALGTNLLVRTATVYQAEQLILLSTDKAVDPVSMMGASKRIAELTLLAHHKTGTSMKVVRLGNVLGSVGSVVPLFLRQIAAGGPVTVTHPEARRYLLTTEDAVVLLLEAASTRSRYSVAVPGLGEPVLMESLARHLIAGHRTPGGAVIPIVFTQLRLGDKMCEALLSARESYVDSLGSSGLRAVSSPGVSSTTLDEVLDQLQRACRERSLEQLLSAVAQAVPEYRPSAFIADAAAQNLQLSGQST